MKQISLVSNAKKSASKILVAATALVITLVYGSVFAGSFDQDAGSNSLNSLNAPGVEAVVDASSGVGAQFVSSNDLYSYKAYYGSYNGKVIATLNWSVITASSRVFASCNEGGFIGGAKYTVSNVAARNGSVQIWVDIAWGSPIRLYCDYLVVN